MADVSPQAAAALQGVTFEGNEFASLLNKEFKPKSDEARSAVEQAVLTLAQQALSRAQLIGVLHHADFQKLESAWRGLHYLVNNTETDEMLKIRVLNISKGEVGKALKRYKGTSWDQSQLFKKIYNEEYDMFGGHPFGCLVGDYYFDHTPPDVEMLGELSKIAAAALAPFIAEPVADEFVAGTRQPA